MKAVQRVREEATVVVICLVADSRCDLPCEQARHFLLTKFSELRNPKSNVQITQEHVLLRHKYVKSARLCYVLCLS